MAKTNEWSDHPAAMKHGEHDAFGISVTREEAIKIIRSLVEQLDGVPSASFVGMLHRHDKARAQRFLIIMND